MDDKIYKKNVYDIDLKCILRDYEKGFIKLESAPVGKSITDFTRPIRLVIEDYCRLNKIDFEREHQIIVTADDGGTYECFLFLSLIFLDCHKIRQYLNHHKKLFNSGRDSDQSFIGLVEYIVVDGVKNASPFDNSQRLNEIMQWVEDKREPALKAQKKSKIPSPPTEYKLIWDKVNLPALKVISIELSKRKYTRRKTDFSDVFLYQKVIHWKKSIQSWAYLISKLSGSPFKSVSNTRNERYNFSVSRKFFLVGDDEKTINEKVNYPSMVYNMINGRSKKHAETMAGIDSILQFVFEK
ncbi:hypothetical protein [Pararhizobium sp.]|uniref:hypothetical protein n=1 Tax=Pararhizobium sp. TaxID=1977563 RepID=UPI00271726A9|nr:hypothetical protein [Pararhizobium sp.]MDO9415291.1 hypothetical protein [Pararhizobium sp.]